ncbi:hypothetical protein NNRS527_02664 [Nitrosospira sp. NRS527]|nr:hypothetical protein NNRS527_02664 [Nitrosospira sp. NRS527]
MTEKTNKTLQAVTGGCLDRRIRAIRQRLVTENQKIP